MSLLRITTSGTYLGSVMQNVLHFANPGDAITLAQAAAEVRDNWADKMRNAHASGFAYTNIAVKNLSDLTQQTFNLPYAAAGVGEPSAPHMVLAFILTLRCSAAGRRGRGRVYIAAPRSGWVSNSLMTAAGMTFLQANAIDPITTRFLGASRTGPLEMQVYHAESNSSSNVLSLTLRQYLGVQRRRNINVGI